MKLNYMAALIFVLARLKEPSSYAGLAGFLVALNVPDAADLNATIVKVGVAAAGILAVMLPEKK